jgi:SAM-dependent methyltransferase
MIAKVYMDDVREHYQNLLAKHYSWMFGLPFSEMVAIEKAILMEVLGSETEMALGLAVDLGCGPGFQSIALAQIGFSPVMAIDTCSALLNEMQAHQGSLPIQHICGDLKELSSSVSRETAQVVVCMGDTITHLDSKDSVEQVAHSVAQALAPGGVFIISYRDLSSELRGLDRFIPVYSDARRTMTCFLEFDTQDSVLVNDLVYSRLTEGWQFSKSSYRKLRLPKDWLVSALNAAGLRAECGQAFHLVRVVARKPMR